MMPIISADKTRRSSPEWGVININGNNLYFTHQMNGTRCRYRDLLTNKLKGRLDPKVDALAAEIPDFEPPK